jgi:hypothetical protein
MKRFWKGFLWGASVDVVVNVGVWMYKAFRGGQLSQ